MRDKRKLKLNVLAFATIALTVGILFFANFHQVRAFSIFGLENIAGAAVKKLVAYIAYLIINIAGIGLFLSGSIFDYAAQFSILNWYGNGGFIENSWTTVRDLTNIVFIFVLLYTAIMTILQQGSAQVKEVIKGVVIIALLVNFSLVITKVVIDSSNLLAVEFYNKINSIKDAEHPDDPTKNLSLSAAVVGALNPQKFFAPNEDFGKGNSETTLFQILIASVFGIIFIVALSFVLLAGGLMFVARTATLWFIMILSPAAFVAYIIPATRSHFSKWWKTLLDQAFFAPFYMFFLYLTVQIISTSNIIGTTTLDNKGTGLSFMSPDTATIGLIFKYLIVLFLLGFSLVISKQMGASGADAAQKHWNKGKGWLQKKATDTGKRWAQKAPGGVARGVMGSERGRAVLKGFAAKSPRLGGAVLRTVQSGTKLGLNEEAIKRRAETARALSPEQQAAYFAKLGRAPIIGLAGFGIGTAANFIAGDDQAQRRMLSSMNSGERNRLIDAAKGDPKTTGNINKFMMEPELFEKLSSLEKLALYERSTDKNEIEKKMLSQEEFEKLSARDKVEFEKLITALTGNTAAFSSAVGRLSKEDNDKFAKEKIEIERRDKIELFIDSNKAPVDLTNAATRDNFKNIRPDEVAKLRDDMFTDTNMDVMLELLKPAHFQRVYDRGDNATEKLVERMILTAPTPATGKKTFDDVISALKAINPSAAAWASSPQAKNSIEAKL